MIERQVLNDRPVTIGYLDQSFNPTDKDSFAFAKLSFDDGETLFLSAPEPPKPPKPSKSKTFNTWSMAISILDKSEVEIRDLIERDLQDIAGVSGTRYGTAMRVVDRLMVKIKSIRIQAVKQAFRFIRDNS